MHNGLLIRVGVDATAGGWNAPCKRNGQFCYVPIEEGEPRRSSLFNRTYNEFSPFVAALGAEWPERLNGECHLDPDFAHLTYGDSGSKGTRIRHRIVPGAFIVFWAGLRCLDGDTKGKLICSIIGFFRVSHVVQAQDVSFLDAHRNAHTRRAGDRSEREIIVFADPRQSGRLLHHIRIGSHRDGAQRVDREILKAWGDLTVKDGFIQRSIVPPGFRRPNRFLDWFWDQNPKLIHANNVAYS